jgi:hypothetical protein
VPGVDAGRIAGTRLSRVRAVFGCLVALVLLGGCTTTVSGVASAVPPATSAAAPVPPAAPVPSPAAVPSAPAAGAFSDAGNRFTIVPPPGWVADTSGVQGTAVVFRAPTAGGTFRANLNVIVVPATAELAATIQGARRELRTLPGYTATDDEPAALADGTPAHLLGGTFTDAGSGAPLRNLQIFTVRGRSGVVATGTAPAGSWPSFAEPVDTALRTLRVGG